jgi:hypothetical protein
MRAYGAWKRNPSQVFQWLSTLMSTVTCRFLELNKKLVEVFSKKKVFVDICTKTLKTNIEPVHLCSRIWISAFFWWKNKDSHHANESTGTTDPGVYTKTQTQHVLINDTLEKKRKKRRNLMCIPQTSKSLLPRWLCEISNHFRDFALAYCAQLCMLHSYRILAF